MRIRYNEIVSYAFAGLVICCMHATQKIQCCQTLQYLRHLAFNDPKVIGRFDREVDLPIKMIVTEIIMLNKKVDDWVLINTNTIASIRAVLIRSANTLRINS